MQKRTIIAIFIAFLMTIGLTALWSAESNELEGDDASNIVAASGSQTGETVASSEGGKKKGNRFARFFKAPIRAVGKLVGFGKDHGKLQRLTEKDVKGFESAGLMRVTDMHSVEGRDYAEKKGTAQGHFAEGKRLLEHNRLSEAIAALSQAAAENPRHAEAHNLLGVAFGRKGMHERGRSFYDRAIRLQHANAEMLNNFGYSLYLSGNYRAAVDRLKRARGLAPNNERILNNLALAECRLGRYDDAYKNFARARGEFDGRMNVATLLERMGRDHEAIAHYEAARTLQPGSSVVERRLSDLYKRTGQLDKAATLHRPSAEVASNN